MNTGEIILYQSPDGATAIDVKLEQETVWLSLNQMAELFDRDKSVISRHISKIYAEKELDYDSTVAKNATVQTEGAKSVVRSIEFYNLDVIISVGYRVKSQRGTQFRIWANKVLKEYLIKGYAVKDTIKLEQYEDLKQTIKLLSNVMDHRQLNHSEATGLLKVVTDYAYALDTLDKYDYQQLTIDNTTTAAKFEATYESAKNAIKELRDKFGGSSLFGHEKDQ